MRCAPDEPLVPFVDLALDLLTHLEVHGGVNDPRPPPQVGKRPLKHARGELRVDEDLVGLARRGHLHRVDRRAVRLAELAREREGLARARVARGRREVARRGRGRGREEEVGEVAVEDDAVLAEPAQERDGEAQLVDDDDVEGLGLATRGPVEGRGKGVVERDDEEGQEREGREVEEEAREEERRDEVQLSEHDAHDGEAAKDGPREEPVAQDVDLQRACAGGGRR